MSKHTPGPWEAASGEVTTERIEGRSFRRIAAVQDYGMGSLPEVDEANARLIAAAPELLHSLRGVLHWAECECKRIRNETPANEEPVQCDYCTACDVIAKAEGRDA